MASKTYEGNYKAYLLTSAPADYGVEDEGLVEITATELQAGTQLERLISAGGVTYTYNQNTASQALVDLGKISHAIGTREVSGMTVTHEIDFPLSSDSMWSTYAYGDLVYLVIYPGGEPGTGDVGHLFVCETGEPQTAEVAQDTKQNFTVTFAVQDWDLNITAAV